MIETDGIAYSSFDSTTLALDAFVPQANASVAPPGSTPAVILIHGGDYTANSRTIMDPLAKQVASAGFAAFSIDYTLSSPSQTGYPVEVNQVLDAVTWVRTHASSYHLNPAAIVLLGSSAGATLAVDAALVGPTNSPPVAVQAAVGWSGAYLFVATASAPAGSLLAGSQDYIGCSDTSSSCKAKAAGASPINHIHATSAPILLAASSDYKAGCEIVNPEQAKVMYSALLKAGVTSVLHMNDQCAHAQEYSNVELTPTLEWFRSVLQ